MASPWAALDFRLHSACPLASDTVVWDSQDGGGRKDKDLSQHACPDVHIFVAVCTCPPYTCGSSCTAVVAFAGDSRVVVVAVCKPLVPQHPPCYGSRGYRTWALGVFWNMVTPREAGWACPSVVTSTLPPGAGAIACSSPAAWVSTSVAADDVASSHNSCLPSCAQESIPVVEVVVVVVDAAVVVVDAAAAVVVVDAAAAVVVVDDAAVVVDAAVVFFSSALDDTCMLPPFHACKLHNLVAVVVV